MRGVDQADDAVLDEVADVDRIRHGRGHAPRERFDEGDAGDDAAVLTGGNGLGAHYQVSFGDSGSEYISRPSRADAHHRNGDTN